MLKNRVAIITGGNRGIGMEIGLQFGREGCSLALVARGAEELRAASKQITDETGADVEIFAVDVSQEDAVRQAARKILDRFQKVDILVNAAGIVGPIGRFEACDAAEWERTVRINLMGIFYMTQAIVPHMIEKKYGAIINFSGGGAFGARLRFSAYSVSKAAVVRLTDSLAQELKEYGITANAIAPGQINSRMFEEMVAAGKEKLGEASWKEFEERKRTGGDDVAEVGRLAVFLASEQARKITGKTISPKWDPWKLFPQHLDELESSDIYSMRRIKPEDYGKHW